MKYIYIYSAKYYSEMSLRDSPKDVHHLRNVVGDNNDGYGHL